MPGPEAGGPAPGAEPGRRGRVGGGAGARGVGCGSIRRQDEWGEERAERQGGRNEEALGRGGVGRGGRARPPLPARRGPAWVCSRQRRARPRGPAEGSITNFTAASRPSFFPIIVRRQLRARPPARHAAPARARSIDTATGRQENSFFSPSPAPGGRRRSSASGGGGGAVEGPGPGRGCRSVPGLTWVWKGGFQGIRGSAMPQFLHSTSRGVAEGPWASWPRPLAFPAGSCCAWPPLAPAGQS